MNQPISASAQQQQSDFDPALLNNIARRFGTPAYVYSADAFTRQFQRLSKQLSACEHQICYAVKANSNLAVLQHFAALGSGFDIVSGGELVRVMKAGGRPEKVVFSGVGKSISDIDFALQAGIGCFNVESEPELHRIEARAQLIGRQAPISVRVNPDVDAATHPYISTGKKNNKFGVPSAQAKALYSYAAASAHLHVLGIDCHIGSQITSVEPLLDATDALLQLVDELGAAGIELRHIDLGGGFGICYQNETPLDVETYLSEVTQRLGNRPLTLMLEPGRFLVANGGVLLTRVEYLKPAVVAGYRNFAIVDAAMNDLIRPSLYSAWHQVTPVENPSDGLEKNWDLVGPICESGDFIALDRALKLAPGQLLAIQSAGAYGMSLSSNYNSRPRAAEVLVKNGEPHLVRRREALADLVALEQLI